MFVKNIAAYLAQAVASKANATPLSLALQIGSGYVVLFAFVALMNPQPPGGWMLLAVAGMVHVPVAAVLRYRKQRKAP